MAFIGTSPFLLHRRNLIRIQDQCGNCARQTPRCAADSTRRGFLHLLAAAGSGAVLSWLPSVPALGAEELPGLPAGAREFSRLLSARRQWGELRTVLTSGRELEDAEWESLRGYLRTIYQATADMDFLAKPWDKGLRGRGDEVIKRFRVTVKGMDKPAAAKDVGKFAEMHLEAAKDFDKFFELLKEASVGDIPDEL